MNKKNFNNWNQVEITAYIFQDEKGIKEIVKLVNERIEHEKTNLKELTHEK